jgi:hypothetical protein
VCKILWLRGTRAIAKGLHKYIRWFIAMSEHVVIDQVRCGKNMSLL